MGASTSVAIAASSSAGSYSGTKASDKENGVAGSNNSPNQPRAHIAQALQLCKPLEREGVARSMGFHHYAIWMKFENDKDDSSFTLILDWNESGLEVLTSQYQITTQLNKYIVNGEITDITVDESVTLSQIKAHIGKVKNRPYNPVTWNCRHFVNFVIILIEGQ